MSYGARPYKYKNKFKSKEVTIPEIIDKLVLMNGKKHFPSLSKELGVSVGFIKSVYKSNLEEILARKDMLKCSQEDPIFTDLDMAAEYITAEKFDNEEEKLKNIATDTDTIKPVEDVEVLVEEVVDVKETSDMVPEEDNNMKKFTNLKKEELELEIVNAYKAGLEVDIMTERYNIGRTTVYKILDRHNIPRRIIKPEGKIDNSRKIALYEDYMTGNYTNKYLAEKHNLKYGCLNKFINDARKIIEEENKNKIKTEEDIVTTILNRPIRGHLTEEMKLFLAMEYENGMGPKDIFEKYKVSHNSLYNILNQFNIERKSKYSSNNDNSKFDEEIVEVDEVVETVEENLIDETEVEEKEQEEEKVEETKELEEKEQEEEKVEETKEVEIDNVVVNEEEKNTMKHDYYDYHDQSEKNAFKEFFLNTYQHSVSSPSTVEIIKQHSKYDEFYLLCVADAVHVGLCSGRHEDMPVKKFIFDTLTSEQMFDFEYLQNTAEEFIKQYCFDVVTGETRDLYVYCTGLQSALTAVLAAANKLQIRTYCVHYNTNGKTYHRQVALDYPESKASKMSNYLKEISAKGLLFIHDCEFEDIDFNEFYITSVTEMKKGNRSFASQSFIINKSVEDAFLMLPEFINLINADRSKLYSVFVTRSSIDEATGYWQRENMTKSFNFK